MLWCAGKAADGNAAAPELQRLKGLADQLMDTMKLCCDALPGRNPAIQPAVNSSAYLTTKDECCDVQARQQTAAQQQRSCRSPSAWRTSSWTLASCVNVSSWAVVQAGREACHRTKG